MSFVWVALGGGLGAALRYLTAHWRGAAVGTLVVNLVGSALLGWLVGRGLSDSALLFAGAGFCGGLTTFSAFAVHSPSLGTIRGALYAVGTIGGSLMACGLGFALAA